MNHVTFANYSPNRHGAEGIYAIGSGISDASGVIPEMAQVFSHDLSAQPDVDNLGQLIGKIGPAKELQENIGRVQDVLGTDQDAVGIARGWVQRSALLLPVERTFGGGDSHPRIQYGATIITGGVRNWMQRRAELAAREKPSWDVWLVAGNREMKPAEGADVREGMTEADYMRDIVAPKLESKGMRINLVGAETQVGDEVMAIGAAAIAEQVDLSDEATTLIVVSNAGAWVQNAGQFRRALRGVDERFDANGDQLSALSDTFPLGTGQEPTATHQNPFTALGQIARNAQELARHI